VYQREIEREREREREKRTLHGVVRLTMIVMVVGFALQKEYEEKDQEREQYLCLLLVDG
jgi:hypothetical protein